jgi:hypothetical protein
MPEDKNCPCCNKNNTLTSGKTQLQYLTLDNREALLSIVPGGNSVDLCGIFNTCETLTKIEDFRLVGNSVLEIIYRGEDNVPVSKTVDLSFIPVEVLPFTIADSNTIDLRLNGNEISASLIIDPSSTANVSASSLGLRIDTSPQTPVTVTSTSAITLTSDGTDKHHITADLVVDDTDTIDLSIGASGLKGSVVLANDPRQMITVNGGLFVNKEDIEALITDTQTIDAEAPLVYNIGTNTVSIIQADTDSDGYLSSTDWNLFNDKVPSTRAVNTIGPLLGGGILTSDLTLSMSQASAGSHGYLTSTDWTTFNNKLDPSRTINTVAPLIGGGALTSNLTLSIPAANTSTNGYLTSIDWNTFNNKANTAVNVGGGGSIFKQKTSNNLELRSLTGTSGQIVITQSADTVNIAIDPNFTAGGGGGSDLIVKDEGTNITTSATSLNFVGAGVTVTGTNDAVVTIPGFSSDLNNVSYSDGTYNASTSDVDKVIFLKATTANVSYTINPSTFNKKKLILYSLLTDSFTVTITASSGTIGGNLNYSPVHNECVTIYSDGSNLYAIAKN